MKKNYVKPRTIEVSVNTENVMNTCSGDTQITGGNEHHFRMGLDDEHVGYYAKWKGI